MLRLIQGQRLRLALECRACGQYIDALPEGRVPRELPSGRISVAGCVALGICPVCLTDSGSALTDNELRRIALYLKVNHSTSRTVQRSEP